ncbi:MAG: CPBP family intramembrane metalloprotease [candidate division Zixibacteria bacterium]|nr:CPBP family intramembrane metalloprotease [candidate division Zixibacteria bacterium]MDH3937755.1 CPBP family intramembrane metalloprotease [candidate division Zixibacteria bacterium]MDH4034942.1 CPBP family intramembrane metalloprotease [candidate division Zixibacteria bacterium]
MRIPKLLTSPFLWVYASLYLLCLALITIVESFPIGEALGMAVILGILFPSIAHYASLSAQPVVPFKPANQGEQGALLICLVLVTLFLAVGTDRISAFSGVSEDSPRLLFSAVLIQKLALFVLIPFVIFKKILGFSLSDFGFQVSFGVWRRKKQFRILLVILPIMLLFQYFVGQGAAPIRSGEFSVAQLWGGLPLTYFWLCIEVGLVEEFFFRALLQSRLAARFQSETAGILIAALLFGLAHAPGLFLRGGGELSPVGATPSLLLAIGYSVVVLSAAGLFLGVVWSRTRNLLLVILIHAAVDLLPNFAEFMEIWKAG